MIFLVSAADLSAVLAPASTPAAVPAAVAAAADAGAVARPPLQLLLLLLRSPETR